MEKLFISLLITLAIAFNLKCQIHSTLAGGYWHESTTWIGGVVPDSNSDIIIEGPVIQGWVSGYTINSVYCHNLTITTSGSLRNGGYGGGSGVFPVYVGGNVLNNGIVENGPEDELKIFIDGDLENNNIWMPFSTEFCTAVNHNLSLASGKSFGSKILNNGLALIALTDLYFTCDWYTDGNPRRDHLYLNNQALILGSHSIRLYPSCLINRGRLQGDFQILGTFTTGWVEGYDIRDTLVFEGNITVTDTLRGNSYGGGYGIYRLKVIGNITNNGVIRDDYDTDDPLNNDDLNLLVSGNIVNNGVWGCNYTTFIGLQSQYIFQANGKYFDSFLNDYDPSSSIIAQSDITVSKDINLNGTMLDMANHVLKINSWLKNGNVSNCILQNGFLQNINSINTLKIRGKVTVDDGNTFQNTIIVEDTLQSNEYGGGSKYFMLSVLGDITNNGVIQNINQDDMLSMELNGDVFNNGEWKNSRTRFVNTQPRNIGQSPGKMFVTDFFVLDSASIITASTDISNIGNFDLGNSNVYMQGHEFKLEGNLFNGKIHKVKLKNARLYEVSVYDSLEIKGIVKIDNGNNFYGNVLVTDTLQSVPYSGGACIYNLSIFGDLTNYGLIRDEPTEGELFAVYIMGDIINHGKFNNYRVHQLYYQNLNINSVQCFNHSANNWVFNSAGLSENDANAFTILNGGGSQNVLPDQSYDLTIQFTPIAGDSTAILNIDCTEIGSLAFIYLIGSNYPTALNAYDNPVIPTPDSYKMFQNFPNPFNPNTRIKFELPEAGNITLKIYDLLGKEINVLIDEYKEAGIHEIDFNASRLSSGVYFYRLNAGEFTETKKMILLK